MFKDYTRYFNVPIIIINVVVNMDSYSVDYEHVTTKEPNFINCNVTSYYNSNAYGYFKDDPSYNQVNLEEALMVFIDIFME